MKDNHGKCEAKEDAQQGNTEKNSNSNKIIQKEISSEEKKKQELQKDEKKQSRFIEYLEKLERRLSRKNAVW